MVDFNWFCPNSSCEFHNVPLDLPLIEIELEGTMDQEYCRLQWY